MLTQPPRRRVWHRAAFGGLVVVLLAALPATGASQVSPDSARADSSAIDENEPPWWLAGFYDRRSGDISRVLGNFLDREEFGDWNVSRTIDLLRRMQGVSIRPVNSRIVRFIAHRPGDRRGMHVYVNGGFVGSSEDFDLDKLVNLVHIEAVEAYSRGWVPEQFRRRGYDRGVLLIWT